MGGEQDRDSPGSVGDVVEVRVERLAAGGEGVARLSDGRVLFVPFTAPGDRARIRVSQSRRRFARGTVEELLEAGPGRIDAPCPVFGRCGGCAWQHLRYEDQLEAKRSILRDALARIGGLEPPADIPVLPSPPYGYRTRTRVLVASGRVGFRRRRSHELCAVERCPVLVEPLEAKLAELRARVPAGNAEWELTAGHGGVVRTSRLSGRRARASEGEGSARIELQVAGERLRVSPGVFLQSNVHLIEPLVAAVLRAARRAPDDSGSRDHLLLELFAGAGLFTLPLARAFSRVVAVDSDSSALRDLRANLRSASLRNVEVVGGRVEHALDRLRSLRPHVVMLDPPRAGLGRASSLAVSDLAAARVVYLSCDPATLARDLAVFAERGYELGSIEAFDLFPQTPHVEALAVLER